MGAGALPGSSSLTLTLLAPDGTAVNILQRMVSGFWFDGLAVQLPVSGTYTVRLNAGENREGTGRYEFALHN